MSNRIVIPPCSGALCIAKGKNRQAPIADSNGQHTFEWASNLPLCESAGDLIVSMLCYEWIDKKGTKITFTWTTDLPLKQNNVQTINQRPSRALPVEN